MEDAFSAQRSTPAPQGGGWPYSFPQAVGNEPRLNLSDHDGHIRVRHFAGERCLSECVIDSGLTPEVIDCRIMHANMFQRLRKTLTKHSKCNSLPSPSDSPDMLPSEHVWDWVGRRLARDPRSAASKDVCCAH
ncbi:hypothetical protein TNCV_1684421 [Trichonephila clavipes]|nr:hypothetical protein TNCV_1684421 [Trichonephila clavipes]